MTMPNTDVFDKDLNPILESADNEDLSIIVDYLNGKISCGLESERAYKHYYPNHSKYADLIAKELRDMGGNSFANLFRGFEGPSYKEITQDVAKKLKVPFNKNADVATIEHAILSSILEKAFSKMSDSEKQKLVEVAGNKSNIFGAGPASTAALLAAFNAGGFFSYQLTVIIANQVARTVLGSGLAFATNATLTRVAAIVTGPIGWAVAGAWTAVDIAGPAYKVTIPSVIQVAMIRAKLSQ